MSSTTPKPGAQPQPTSPPRPAPGPKPPGALVIARPPHPAPKLLFLCLVLVLVFTPGETAAQSLRHDASRRLVVVAGTGFGTTCDDEGLLGRGPAISGGVGVWLTERIALMAFVDRVSYYRDVDWLTFEGRTLFGGVEASVRFSSGRTSPYVSGGAGVLNDSGIWLRKVQTGPSSSRIEERIDRTGSRATMTVSCGLDVAVASRVSVRGGVRLYGLLDTGDDLFPHIGLQPTVGVLVRF
jgi:hypothetical protein